MSYELLKNLRAIAEDGDRIGDSDSRIIDSAIELIEQQERDIAALQSDIEAQIRIASEEATRAAKLERDAEILRTLIYRAHACNLKFTKQGGVSSLSATFKSNTVPGVGMSDGVRRYLDAFMQDAAIAAAKEGE